MFYLTINFNIVKLLIKLVFCGGVLTLFEVKTSELLECDFLNERGNLNAAVLNQGIHKILAEYFDTKFYSYIGFNFPNNDDLKYYTLTNLTPAAAQSYMDDGYVYVDPFVLKGLNYDKPYLWKDVEVTGKRQFKMINNLKKFGIIFDIGISIPIHGDMGEIGVFSFDIGEGYYNGANDFDLIIGKMEPFARLLHQKMIDHASQKKTTDIMLTPRQMEVLKWASEGKSCLDTSVIMSISENTVRNHLNLARLALNANNTTHACSIAIKNNLLIR